MKLFVYGTLMKGQGANSKLKGAQFLGKAVLRDYEMFNLGGFPGIQQHLGGSVVGELYEIEEDMLPILDSYEGEGSLYNREIVNVCIYRDKESQQTPMIYPEKHKAYAYIYTGQSDDRERLPFEWGVTEEDYVWYGAYGSNIDEERFLCYIEGGECSANGKYYDGCRDTSKWIDEDVALFPGSVYASQISHSWKGKGVAFYDENERDNLLKGFAFMKLYKIRRGQLEDVQEQECNKPNWYGRVVVAGINIDGMPVYTFTSEKKGSFNEPDVSYATFIRDATRKVCKKYGIGMDYGLETCLILMGRNPYYSEKPKDKIAGHHPYRLLCLECLNEEKYCTCKRREPFRYRCYEEIDEDMFDAVRMLNQKGYYTRFSCQGGVEKNEKRIHFSSYIMFCDSITEDLPLPDIDPEFIKIKRRKKDNSFNSIYIECTYKIGKTNAEKQEEKVRTVKDSVKQAWLKMAKAWPIRDEQRYMRF